MRNKVRGRKWLGFFAGLGLVAGGIGLAVYHPDTPLPDHWNPIKPLDASAPLTPLTTFKLARISGDKPACLAALETISDFSALADKAASRQCHIRNRVQANRLANVRIARTETRCDLALTTAMWLRHGVMPAAEFHFGQGIAKMRTQGSYNCRKIAGSSRMSLHAQAKAIDVAGFTLDDGTRIEMSRDWQGGGAKASFLRDVRDISCTWFDTALGPDYNRAHHDHFHLQIEGWGTCR